MPAVVIVKCQNYYFAPPLNSFNMHRVFAFLLLFSVTISLSAQSTHSELKKIESTQLLSMNRGSDVQFPYPILYVHGLVGSSASWQEMSEWLANAVGDPIDLEFCLNADGSLYSSDAADDIESFIPSNLQSASQYIINFNCNASGTCSTIGSLSQSNQSGIYKQAEAIGMAIEAILDATGKAKVILLGHSMGGVACRQYLQNSDHWPFSTHRVAKLITSGSPHVGFDLGSKLFKTPGLFVGIDTDSEAFRDLKNEHTGFLTSTPGVFFWGGEEDQDYMYDDIFYWWNVDVNCNGSEGELVEGLNERSMYTDLEFASIYDTYDLVVSPTSADYNFIGETTGGEDLCSVLANGWFGDFHCESWGWDVPGGATLGHNELPEQLLETLWALDEADDYVNSYEVDMNQWYTGFLTPQSSSSDGYAGYNGPYATDWDDFIVTVPAAGGTLIVSAEFDQISEGGDLLIYDVNSGEYINWIENVDEFETLSTSVNGGEYIIEFNHDITTTEGFGQYFFLVTLDQANSIDDADRFMCVEVWPNPAADVINIKSDAYTAPTTELYLFDAYGRMVMHLPELLENAIDISSIPNGSYNLVIQTAAAVHTEKVLIRR